MDLSSGKGQDFLLVLPCFYTMKRIVMAGNFSATPTSSGNNHTQNRELELPLLLATIRKPKRGYGKIEAPLPTCIQNQRKN